MTMTETAVLENKTDEAALVAELEVARNEAWQALGVAQCNITRARMELNEVTAAYKLADDKYRSARRALLYPEQN
jgi:hypothetical protein